MWEEVLLAVLRIALILSELILFSGKRFVELRLSEFLSSLKEFLLESDLST
jgi:hypothetical protein